MHKMEDVPMVSTYQQNAKSEIIAPRRRGSGAFSLPALPYPPDSLEPVIGRRTLGIHHGKHHATYVKKLNEAVLKEDAVNMNGVQGNADGMSLEALITNASKVSKAVRNNAGGHYNHSLFWQMMGSPDTVGKPSAVLLKQIFNDFGSLDQMKEKFNDAGANHFASGWAWLIWRDGKLDITTTPGHDSPIMDDAKVKGEILFLNDVWEHAYYLRYQNKRDEYLRDWWQILNWTEVNKRYEKLTRQAGGEMTH
jgi:Fe-Mn family superoxide dismutase